MNSPLRVLNVDDRDDDVAMISSALRRAGVTLESRRVDTPGALRDALAERWDLVLGDWSMPGFDGIAAFRIVRELDTDVPFIMVSGTVDEEVAVTALKAGVNDFISKDKLARLLPAIERELKDADVRRRQRDADAEVARQRELIARSEDRYRSMFEASPLLLWTIDPSTQRFVAINDAAARHHGYTRDEMLALGIADLRLPGAPPGPDGRLGRPTLWRHRRKDGSIISVETTASAFVSDGRELRLVAGTDVTERERTARLPAAMWIALALLVGVAAIATISTQHLVHTMSQIEHTHRVVEGLDTVDGKLDDLTTKSRGYALTGDHEQLREYQDVEDALASALTEVRAEVEHDLNTDSATERRQLDELQRVIDERERSLSEEIRARQDLGFDAARQMQAVRDGVHATATLDAAIAPLVDEERRLLGEQRDDTARQIAYGRIALGTGMVLSFEMLWLAFTRLARETRKRRVAEEAARRDEASLATTLQSIGDGVISTDRAGRITRINAVAERLTGWPTAGATGRSFKDVFRTVHEGTREPTSDPADLALRQGTVVALEDHALLIARDGRETAIKDSAAPIRDDGGEVTGAVVVFRDASVERAWERRIQEANDDLERRVAERTAELRKSEEQLRQSQKMEAIGRLAGGIAHDFNNLLSVIISYSEMLLSDLPKGTLAPEIAADIDEINKAGLRAAELTRQMLAFSRQQVLMPRVVDVNQVVAGVDKLLRRVIGADIELRFAPMAGAAKVKVDPGQLEQVIMNLVVNARDAMPRGGKLTLETAAVELESGRRIMLAVTDTGVGMSREIQDRVFEPFFTTKDQGKGTGLGLSTVYGIVQQSGGTVWLYSEPGIGTAFKIYFPESTDTLDESARAAPARTPRGAETILLVEDEPALRSLARGILQKAGYYVVDACDGEDALVQSGRIAGPIQLVVTDVVMPRLSGRELVERLAKLRPDTKVLFMSGYTDDTIVHHGVLDHEVAFVQKPITPHALTTKVREVLDSAPRKDERDPQR
jgi:hypothetical protein